MKQITLVMHCPDQKGIIAGVTNFIHNSKGNILYIDQYVDRENKTFFMRVEVALGESNFHSLEKIQQDFKQNVGRHFDLNCSFYDSEKPPKMAVFVSKYDHCLYDILSQQLSGELSVEIPFILSNHQTLEHIANRFNIPFYHIPITQKTKVNAEQMQLKLLQKHEVDFIVLARYMQIISPQLIEHYPNKIINIHHSFLPAFPGAKPYHSAFDRGVKIIGATSHYITEELDAGPIIEQDISRVTHLHQIQDFLKIGRDLERVVLVRALKMHTDRKVMVYNNKTIVFV